MSSSVVESWSSFLLRSQWYFFMDFTTTLAALTFIPLNFWRFFYVSPAAALAGWYFSLLPLLAGRFFLSLSLDWIFFTLFLPDREPILSTSLVLLCPDYLTCLPWAEFHIANQGPLFPSECLALDLNSRMSEPELILFPRHSFLPYPFLFLSQDHTSSLSGKPETLELPLILSSPLQATHLSRWSLLCIFPQLHLASCFPASRPLLQHYSDYSCCLSGLSSPQITLHSTVWIILEHSCLHTTFPLQNCNNFLPLAGKCKK